MERESNETIIIKYISTHKGSLSLDIWNGINKRGRSVTINTVRKFLRKLMREKKVIRTGVHAFRYHLKK